MERQGVEKKLWEAWEDDHPDGAYKTSMLQTLSQLLGTSEKAHKQNTLRAAVKLSHRDRINKRSTMSTLRLPEVVECHVTDHKERGSSEGKTPLPRHTCSLKSKLERIIRLKEKIAQRFPKFTQNNTAEISSKSTERPSSIIAATPNSPSQTPAPQNRMSTQCSFRKLSELSSKQPRQPRKLKLDRLDPARSPIRLMKQTKVLKEYWKKPLIEPSMSNEFGDMKLFRF